MVLDRDWVSMCQSETNGEANDGGRFEVSVGMKEEGGFQYNWDMAKFFFGDAHNLSLWTTALGLAIILRIITIRFHHQLIFPICELFLLSPVCASPH